jgi:hypothetical protein
MNALEKKARGQLAANLLADETLKEALREVRFAAHRAFERAKGDTEALARASAQLVAANDFQTFLTLAVKHGTSAAKEIDRELQGGKFVRGIGRLVRNRDEAAEDMPWHQASR